MAYEMPRIRLEFDHMRQAIVHAMTQRNREIEAAVAETLANMIETFDFQAAIAKVARDVMETEITQYFMRGEGRRFINETIWAAMDRVYDPDVAQPTTIVDLVSAFEQVLEDLTHTLDWMRHTQPWPGDDLLKTEQHLDQAKARLAILKGDDNA